MRFSRRYPAGVPCWVEVEAPDIAAAAAFYGDLFGWQVEEPGHGGVAIARLAGAPVAGIRERDAAEPGAVWTTSIATDDVAATAQRVVAAGGQVIQGPTPVPEAGHSAVCADPSAVRFRLWQADGFAGAQRVNEPCTWNWSDLAAADVSGAQAFYGAVFGWEADDLSFGGEVAYLWRLPGYGDILARFDPDIRERHAEAGAPPGFSDAIGWLTPVSDEAPDPGWSVTFAVDDTDAIVGRATQLGGDVQVPPFDAGDTRMAVLSDPDGATFTVSHHLPSDG